MAIDVGIATSLKDAGTTDNNTYICADNPANVSGTITKVYIWADADCTSVKVGIFYNISGNIFSTRSYTTIGAVTAGSEQSFDVNLAVETGDYIGFYEEDGELERDNSGGSGYWYSTGDDIPADNNWFQDGLSTTRIIHLYGTGEEAGGITHYGATTLSGVGTLVGIGRGIFIGKSNLSGFGTLIAIGRGIFIGISTLTGLGTLSGIGRLIAIGKVTLTGMGTLTALGRRIVTGVATLIGTGLFSALGEVWKLGSATLTGVGSLTAKVVGIFVGKATLSGIGSLAAISEVILGVITYHGSAILSGIGTLATIGTVIARIRNTQVMRVKLFRLAISRLVISRVKRIREV